MTTRGQLFIEILTLLAEAPREDAEAVASAISGLHMNRTLRLAMGWNRVPSPESFVNDIATGLSERALQRDADAIRAGDAEAEES